MLDDLLSCFSNLPDIWGEGAIFAFSGMDGRTDVASGFVATYGHKPYGLLFHTPRRRLLDLALPGTTRIKIATGDVYGGSASRGDFLVTFCAWHTIAGIAPTGASVALRFEDGPEAVQVDDCWVTEDAGAGDVIALASHGRRFAVAYGRNRSEALDHVQSGLARDVYADARDRLAVYNSLPALQPARRDWLFKKCFSVMKVNTLSSEGQIACPWSTPDRVPHRHMWLWDSAFHSFGMNPIFPRLSRDFLRAMLDSSLADGMIPFQVTIDGPNTQWTQAPILAWAVWENHQALPDRNWLAWALPKLENYLEWNCAHRDANGNGLLEWGIGERVVSRGAESGLDNSPRFDRAVPLDAVDFSTFLVLDMQYTAQIASELGQMERASVWQTRSRSIAARVHSYLWDDQDGFYYDRDVSGAFERVQAVSGFFPLLLDDIPAEHIGALVTALHDPRRFDAPWPVPSLALSHPAFSTDMWRGPTWINTNYVIIQGLLKHGLADEARWLAQATIALVEKYYERYGVLFEFFDAQDRVPPPLCDRKGPHQEPYNIRRKMDSIRDYHWTAALTARLLLDETDRKKGKAPQ